MEPSTNNILRDRGLALQAIACLDTAIWDVFGKAVGLPLHRLWGSVTDSLPMSVIGGYYHLDLDQTRELIAGYAERFSGVKFKVGGRTPREDAERVRVAREAAGPDFAIMVDANQGYERAQAVEFGRLVADLDLRWFEEPCRWTNDRRWMRDVRLQTGIPVAAGQSEIDPQRHPRPDRGRRHRRQQLRRLVGGRPDHLAQGGRAVRGLRRRSWAITRSPRSSSHLLASTPNHTFVECFDEERDPFFWALCDLSTFLRDGRLHLPERPGFGTQLDWDYVERYTVDRRATTA